jgi:DNA-3-methyladenine glycosylase II
MEVFRYGTKEIEYLKARDEKLGRAIERVGMIEREVIPDLFSALVSCIVSQQISAKAADTVWSRLQERLGEITPQSVSFATVESIQQCGTSTRKAGYIKGIGDWASQDTGAIEELQNLPDDEVIRRLSALKGVGVWTAEMILIFSMRRPDVVSWGDLAIRRGMMNLYGLEELTRTQFDEYQNRYSPCGSVASLYLWELSHEEFHT